MLDGRSPSIRSPSFHGKLYCMLETACPQCQQKVPQGAGRCPACQTELTPATPDPAPREIMPKWVWWGLNGTTVGLLLVNLVLLLCPTTDFEGNRVTTLGFMLTPSRRQADLGNAFVMAVPRNYTKTKLVSVALTGGLPIPSQPPTRSYTKSKFKVLGRTSSGEVLQLQHRMSSRKLHAYRYDYADYLPKFADDLFELLSANCRNFDVSYELTNYSSATPEALDGYDAVRWSYTQEVDGKTLQTVVIALAHHDSYFVFVQKFDPAVDGDVCIELDSMLRTLRFK